MVKIMTGTSGWSYPDWQGAVYPPEAGSRFDELIYLANFCDTIEINSSFYRIPNQRSVASWLNRTASLPEFRFSAKLFKGLTHERDARTRDELIHETVEAFLPIYESQKLAAILIQFPWSFKYGAESMAWLEWLVKKLSPMPLAVEVRHTSWLNDTYYDFLKSERVAFCNIDQPTVSFAKNIPPTEIITAKFGYIRFHGRNAGEWFTEKEDASQRYNYLYTSQELDEWVDRIHRMARDAERIYIYMNNHVGGQGLANALELKSKLSGKKVPVPRQLLLKFPSLENIAVPYEEPAGMKKSHQRRKCDQDSQENLLF
jgi:uncharacterized protein YecE (DUF72 family)